MLREEIKKRLQELANIKPISEAPEGCKASSCQLEVFHENKLKWSAKVKCLQSSCSCEGMSLGCDKVGSKTLPLNESLKRTLRKKGYKGSFDKIKVKGSTKKSKLKEGKIGGGCKGVCSLRVNGVEVATTPCEPTTSRGCQCGGSGNIGECNGDKVTIINLVPDIKRK